MMLAGPLAGPAAGQDSGTVITQEPLDPPTDNPAVEAQVAPGGAVLRALDRLDNKLVDFTLEPGQTKQLGRIMVSLGECRYPVGNPAGDAFAYLVIRDINVDKPVFKGWMIASSPALNALDHPRYDVWVLRCITP